MDKEYLVRLHNLRVLFGIHMLKDMVLLVCVLVLTVSSRRDFVAIQTLVEPVLKDSRTLIKFKNIGVISDALLR